MLVSRSSGAVLGSAFAVLRSVREIGCGWMFHQLPKSTNRAIHSTYCNRMQVPMLISYASVSAY